MANESLVIYSTNKARYPQPLSPVPLSMPKGIRFFPFPKIVPENRHPALGGRRISPFFPQKPPRRLQIAPYSFLKNK
jgi:hypothetical protein